MDASRTLNNKGKDLVDLEQFTAGPINVLPPEILREIFLATLDKRIPTHSAPPMVLCHVSALWKQIALSTPCLWTRLAINRDTTAQDMAGVTSVWFSLAKGLPLSLRIQNQQTWQHSSRLSISLERSPFIVTPQRLWRRIHNLEIDMYWMSDAVRLLNILVGRQMDLERLGIHYTQWSSPPFIRLKFPPLYKLKRFILSCYHSERITFVSSFDNIPWYQLTHLSMVDVTMTPTTWMVFLRRCTHLQHGFFTLDTDDLAPQGLITLQGDTIFPSMISLKVAFKYKGEWGILDGLSFPSLETLCLGGMYLTTWPSTTSSTFDTPLVKNLTLFRVRIQYTDLVMLLGRMAGLRALVLDIPVHFSPLFERLSNVGGTNVFLPNLIRLSIYHWRSIQHRPNNFDEQAFLWMMRARWYPSSTKPRPPRSSLSSVSIRMARDDSQLKKVKFKLNSLIKHGLFLQIGLARNGYALKKDLDW